MPSWEEDFDPKKRAANPEAKRENEKVAECFGRLFNSYDGKEALQYLRKITKERAQGPMVPESALKHFAGQVYLVDQIERLRDIGLRVTQTKVKAKTKK